MVEEELIVVRAIVAALFFDFVNGFHDSANAIATVVGTRVLKSLHAVSMVAVANVAGPFIFGTAIAATVGKGIIQPEFSTVYVILAGHNRRNIMGSNYMVFWSTIFKQSCTYRWSGRFCINCRRIRSDRIWRC